MPTFHSNILKISDVESSVNQLSGSIRDNVLNRLNRYGCVVGISGGIDSSVTLALAVRALGPERVLGLTLPEKESSPDSRRLAFELANGLGVEVIEEEISSALKGFGCYQRRDEAVKRIFPEFDPETYKMKIGIGQQGTETSLPPVFHLTIVLPDGIELTKRMPGREMRTIIAASNFKQRTRMAFLYYHAEERHFAVLGTANKHEVAEGFFVKFGDGGADLFPLAHLYKSQVYQLAEFLEIPLEIRKRTPTTDTYSAEQTQEEFFYQFPFQQLDLLWYGFENEYMPEEVADVMGMEKDEVEKIFMNFARRRETARYLQIESLSELDSDSEQR